MIQPDYLTYAIIHVSFHFFSMIVSVMSAEGTEAKKPDTVPHVPQGYAKIKPE